MTTPEGFEYDPYSYEIDRDPYPLYRRMRDEAPAYYHPRLDFWALTRFEDCHEHPQGVRRADHEDRGSEEHGDHRASL